MADGKNKLVSQSIEQVDNYKVSPSSFPAVGPKKGEVHAGADTLASGMCESPSQLEDSGDLTPSVWGKGGKAFTVSTNTGESGSAPSKVSMDCSVDLSTGQAVPNVADYR